MSEQAKIESKMEWSRTIFATFTGVSFLLLLEIEEPLSSTASFIAFCCFMVGTISNAALFMINMQKVHIRKTVNNNFNMFSIGKKYVFSLYILMFSSTLVGIGIFAWLISMIGILWAIVLTAILLLLSTLHMFIYEKLDTIENADK